MNVLDGMTRGQALENIYPMITDGDGVSLIIGGRSYRCPGQLGLKEDCGSKHGSCVNCMKHHINAHYNALEAEKKPTWVEPKTTAIVPVIGAMLCELYYTTHTDLMNAEIARANARRVVTAFRDANGGPGEWTIYDKDMYITTETLPAFGAITFATKELAEEVRRRYPSELRLLAGVTP